MPWLISEASLSRRIAEAIEGKKMSNKKILCAPCWEYGFCQYPDNCLEDQQQESQQPSKRKKEKA